MKLAMGLMAMVVTACAGAASAQGVAFDGGAMSRVAVEAPSPAAAGAPLGPNAHVDCFARQRFGALNFALDQKPDSIRLTLNGPIAMSGAHDLGLLDSAEGEKLQVDFPKAWCSVSATTFGAVTCAVAQTWPPQTIEARVLDGHGNAVASGKLSVFSFQLERTHRTSAGFQSDIERDFLELSASLISDADNQKRASLEMRYSPKDCR